MTLLDNRVRLVLLDLGYRKFNPGQPRDDDGKWSAIGAALQKIAEMFDNPVEHHAKFGDGGTVARHEDGSFTIGKPGGGLAAYITDDDLDDLSTALDEAHHGIRSGEPGHAEGSGWELDWAPDGAVLHGEDENEDPVQTRLSADEVDSLADAVNRVNSSGPDAGGSGLPAGYEAKYGQIVEDNGISGTDLSVVVNDRDEVHIARGDGSGRTVPVALDDYDAAELGDDLASIADGSDRRPGEPYTYPSTGVTLTAYEDGGATLAWPDGSSDKLTQEQVADLAELLRAPDEGDGRSSLLDAFRQFTEELHPRVPAGSANGGQFGSKGEQKMQPAKKTASPATTPKKAARPKRRVVIPKGSLGYDPSTNTGTGYGKRHGDKRVHSLQQALNRLGFTDMRGRELADDGKLGPLTTSALKRAQRALGLKADGIASPALLRRLIKMKRRPRAQKTTK